MLLPTCDASVGQVQEAQPESTEFWVLGRVWPLGGAREGLKVGGPVGSWITKGGASDSKDVSPRGATEAGGGCENDPAEQTTAGPRWSHFKGIDH